MAILNHSKPKQLDLLIDHLTLHGSITPLEALEKYGIFRLGARVWELKKKGFLITSKMKTSGGKSFSQYSLVKCDDNGQISCI